MLIDTDVLIWYIRGNESARQTIKENSDFSISVVTYMELVQGMRNRDELNALRKTLRKWDVSIIYISEGISAKAMFYVEQHYLSHSVQLADALIGATAEEHGMTIITGNIEHYKPLKGVKTLRFTPTGTEQKPHIGS